MPRCLLVFCALLALVHAPAAAAGRRALTYQLPYSYIDSAPAIADLRGDGKREIVVNVLCGIVLALDGSFNEVWRYDTREENTMAPTVADLDGDGKPEVLALSMSGRIVCLEGKTGRLRWTATLPSAVNFGKAVVMAADLDGDGHREVLATDSKDTMVCFDAAGKRRWAFTEKGGLNLIPAVGDVDGDGKPEIVTGAPGVPVICISAQGRELWRVRRAGPIGKSHVIVDLDGDGRAEILACVGPEVQAYTNRGQRLWARAMKGDMYGGIAVADADRDGHPEIYAADMKGSVARIAADGAILWTGDIREEVHRSPAIADVDGDGVVEIVVAGYSGDLQVYDPRGTLKESLPMGGSTNGAPTVADLNGDGRLCVIVPVAQTRSLLMYRWDGVAPHPLVLWPEYRGGPTRTSCVAPVRGGRGAAITAFATGSRSVGDTLFSVRVANPRRRALALELTVQDGASRLAHQVEASDLPEFGGRLRYTLAGRAPARLTFQCVVRSGDAVVASQTRTVLVAPYARELEELSAAIARVRAVLPKLPEPAAVEPDLVDMEARSTALAARVAAAGASADAGRERLRVDLEAQRDRAARWAAIVERAAAAGGDALIAIPANPWAAFGGVQELAEGRVGGGAWRVEGFAGERLSAALNLFNASSRPLTVRVDASGPAGALALREVVDSLTQYKDVAADALPRMNEARSITIPAWGARQVWVAIATAGLPAGSTRARLDLRPSSAVIKSVAVELEIAVWKSALPRKQAPRLCLWASQGPFDASQLDALLADQTAHGMDVYTSVPLPNARFDAAGELVGAVDFAAHDGYVRPRVGRGVFLVGMPEGAITGPAPYPSPIWRKAHARYLQAWVAHLRELGVGYADFAMYPVDEPGLVEGLVDRLMEYAHIVREVDPKVQFYADPVAGASMDDLRRMAEVVDIWTPSRNGYLLRQGQDKLAFLKSTGKTVWTYECQDGGRHRSVLGYYRGLAWLAWHRGLTGFGFWTYNSGPSQWDGQDDYSLVYPGDGVIPSKRWESVRDGVQDFTMLAELRGAADRAAAAGRAPEAVREARALLGDGAGEVAAACDLDEFGTLLDADGFADLRRIEDARWEKVQAARRRVARLLEALAQ